jgi:hypothetical protein
VAFPGLVVRGVGFDSEYQCILAQPRMTYLLVPCPQPLIFPVKANYLDNHPWEEELLQSFLPTVLVSLLAVLIPLILLLIAKKAHTILTLSELHDRIMTRYYKFLVVNVLVFFCIGTAALQSFLVGFAIEDANRNALRILSNSFPSAGPFYVGWRRCYQ